MVVTDVLSGEPLFPSCSIRPPTAVSRRLACDGPADIGRHIMFSRIINGRPMVLHGLPTNLSFRVQFDRDHLLKCDEVLVSIHVSWSNHIDRRIDSCGDECHRCDKFDGDPGIFLAKLASRGIKLI